MSAASLVKIDSISINLGKVMDKKVTEKCHHFSIRRYAAEMREKDIRKCVPFVRDDDDESKLRQQLVPLHVPEYRWWRCESCVQDISVASASQSQQVVEKATSSLSRGEIHASACGNKEKDDALIGLTAITGHENSVKDISNQQTGEQTLSLVTCTPCQIPERHTDGTVGEESTGKELTNVCVPEPGGDVAASDVLVDDYPCPKSSSSGDVSPAEKTDSLNKDTRTSLVTNEASKKDVDMDTSGCAKEAGAVEQPSVELQTKQVESTATASCTRRRKKVRLIAELLNVNGEKKSDQLVLNKAMPKEVAPPASTSVHRKRKITQEPSKGNKLPSREAKKARKYKGDAKTTIATIHIFDSDSEEDGASAGTGFRSPVPLQQTGNGPSSSKLSSYKSVPSGGFKDNIGLDLSLNSYMEVDKINTPVPQKKTVLNNDLWRKEGNCIGQSSAPNVSFSKDVVGNISGKNAHSSEMMHQQEISLSLHKKLDLSLGRNNKKTDEPERFSEVSRKKTDQRSETVLEQRSADEIPMDIVELMAMNQYERGLPENERNSCPAKRINQRNPEVMGFSDGHGNGVRSMQKEHQRWNPILSQNNNNQYVVGNRDESHVLPMFGTQNSSSKTLTSSYTQNRLWSGDKFVPRSSRTDTQVSDTYNTAHDAPQSSGMARNFWASGSSSIAHPSPNFLQRLASQTSYMPTCLPSPDLHKGKTIRDLDLNRADPSDSDLGVLLPCPFVANNTGGESNRKETELLQNSYSNEAIPAMQLLSLMDAGVQSSHSFSVDGKKVIEKPFFPCDNHRDLGMDQRANLFEKPLFPQNHQMKEYSGSETAIYKSGAIIRPMPSALIGQDIVKSQRLEKAKKASLPQQNKDWRSRTVGMSGVQDMIHNFNPGQDKQKGVLGASAEVVFPVQRNAPKVTENQKNVSSCHLHGTIVPLKDMSKEEACIVSRNPADFSIPEAGNIYMIGSGDLKFSKDFSCRYRGFNGQRRP
ncbi:hypothetical protein POM88_036312 [Heracleum sosnowskyi]|uniref:Embryonic flower 1 n=1 Tax=Heracleum sosnowskyi TaxID=360622 RepID=A0AAD8HMY4_9APIA|nr:hypothetical protein POM88_036312 [Heracleum sosnowskyi]